MVNQKQGSVYNDAKIWQIGLFSLNNSATNMGLGLMMQYAYYTQNVLGLVAGIIGLIATCTRILDAVVDPTIGFLLDNYNGKFGKFKPFMLVGNILLWTCLFCIFNTPTGWGTTSKYIYTTIFYCLYVVGYSLQTVVTKAGLSALTNNPKRRPIFSGFDQIFTQLTFTAIPIILTGVLAQKYSVGEYANKLGLINPAMWKEAVIIFAAISFCMTILAMIGIHQKDRKEFFGIGTDQKFKLSDFLDVFLHNRPIRMLIVAASTEKLGSLLMSGTLTYIFANILLNSKMQSQFSSVLIVPMIVSSIVAVFISRRFGLKRTFVMSNWISLGLLVAMFILKPNPSIPWAFLSLYLVQKCIYAMGSASIMPMIADCTDYEVSRSNRFVPGMMGTLFSLVDQFISAFSALITGLALTIAGVGGVKILPNQPMNDSFNTAIMVCFCVVPATAHVIAIISMKFYNLNKEKMADIQQTLAERKAAADAK